MIPWGTPTIAPEGDIRVKIGAEDELPPPPVEPPPFVPAPELDADPPPPHPVTTIATKMMIEIVTIRDPIVMERMLAQKGRRCQAKALRDRVPTPLAAGRR